MVTTKLLVLMINAVKNGYLGGQIKSGGLN